MSRQLKLTARVNKQIVSSEVEEIPVDVLVPCRLQPATRTNSSRAKALSEAIGDTIYQPAVVVPNGNGTYTIADGHRRWSVCKARGWKTLPCRIVEGVPAEYLWSVLNKATARIKASDWFATWALCKPNLREEWLSTVPKRVAVNIKAMVKMFGEERAVDLGKREWIDPSCAHVASALHLHMTEYCSRRGKLEPPTKKATGEWLVAERRRKQDMNDWMRLKRDSPKSVAKLIAAVSGKKSFLLEQW